MTNATKAREAAQHCEAKKHALRQTQDGIVVAFVLHPNDIPPALQLAPLGTRYMLALVEIGEDETPINRKDGEADHPSNGPHKTQPAPAESPATNAPTRARRPVAIEKRLAQQAGIAGADPVFQRFLYEYEYAEGMDEEYAAAAIRRECGVKSRSEIIPGSQHAEAWDRLWSRFLAWKHAA